MTNVLAFIATLALCAGSLGSNTGNFAVKGAKLELGDGRVLDDGVILVENGKIAAVGRGVDLPRDTPVIEHKGWIAPGWIAGHSFAGVLEASEDDTRSFLAEARIAKAFEANHSDYSRALRSGITAVVIAPQPDNVASGITAVVKCAGGRIVRDECELELVLDARANRINREPTSPAGSVAELRERFQSPKGAFAAVASGKLPVLIAATQRHEIQRAIEFAESLHLKGALLFAPLAGELAEDLHRSGLSVVLAPIAIGAERREIQSAVALGKAGVPFAFALELPFVSSDDLRISAAQCVREGLDRRIAMRALTSDAARIAGVDSSIGALDKGLDADFVLWSGDPLDLASHPVAVYVDGVERLGGAR